jgi:hypothetical protein
MFASEMRKTRLCTSKSRQLIWKAFKGFHFQGKFKFLLEPGFDCFVGDLELISKQK